MAFLYRLYDKVKAYTSPLTYQVADNARDAYFEAVIAHLKAEAQQRKTVDEIDAHVKIDTALAFAIPASDNVLRIIDIVAEQLGIVSQSYPLTAFVFLAGQTREEAAEVYLEFLLADIAINLERERQLLVDADNASAITPRIGGIDPDWWTAAPPCT
jgi:hypothetical protein